MDEIERKNKKFYITTAIPYVNARPHLGHALEFVQADVIARYHRGRGEAVLLLSGSDDNALKNVQAAVAAGVPTQEFIERHAQFFVDFARGLNVSLDVFQKGSDTKRHFLSSQELWRRCDAAGDIYQQLYEGLYCVGCEAFYAPDELNEQGECAEHPGKKLDVVAEKNYFFRLSRYQERLIGLIASGALAIIPQTRKNEVLAFLRQPLRDISISRSNERAKNWGVPVPDDAGQRIYVWFDALNIYQSGVGFGWDEERYQRWWPADMHVIGKGIIRFHAVYWPAFLLSAGLQVPRSLLVHGYITVDGQKMSKTIGNVIDPVALVKKYGADPVRYYLLREIPSGEDGDFSMKKFEERYNGDLANGLGNLVARVTTLGASISPIALVQGSAEDQELDAAIRDAKQAYARAMDSLRLNEALVAVGALISFADKYINHNKPWSIRGDGPSFARVMANASRLVDATRKLITPFLPETAAEIAEDISVGDSEIKIKKREKVLFPRV